VTLFINIVTQYEQVTRYKMKTMEILQIL